MEGYVTLGIFLTVFTWTSLQIFIIDLKGGVQHTDFQHFANDLGLLVVLLFRIEQFGIEAFDKFFDVVVFYFQVAFGLGDAVLEELEFGIERVSDVEDIVAALVGSAIDFFHFLLKTLEFEFDSVLLFLNFRGFAFQHSQVDFGSVFLNESFEHLVRVEFVFPGNSLDLFEFEQGFFMKGVDLVIECRSFLIKLHGEFFYFDLFFFN